MADRFLNSVTGSDATGDGSYALPKATLLGVAGIDTAGDTIHVAANHAESVTGTQTMAFAGTAAAPTKIICGDQSANPPTASATTATITLTGAAASWQFSGHLYVYGINVINACTGSSSIWLHNSTKEKQLWEKCSLQLTAGSGSIFVNAGSSNAGEVVWKGVDVKFGTSTSGGIQTSGDRLRWEGGSYLAGTATPTALFNHGVNRQCLTEVSGVDFSNLGTGFYFLNNGGSGKLIISNSKLPAGWTGDLHNGPMSSCARVELWNCMAGNTGWRIRVKDYAGELREEPVIVKTGGAGKDTTPVSWKIDTTANANAHIGRFETPPFTPKLVSTVGAPVTATVDILHDNVTPLADDAVWLEVQYFGTSGALLSSFISDMKADILAPGVAQPASAAEWTTTGMANPNKQKLSVTFTPQEAGIMLAKVIVAKAGYTLYVDPAVQVS